MKLQHCAKCGTPFIREDDEHWKKLCILCWKKKKNAPSGNSTFKMLDQRDEIERLRRENIRLFNLAMDNPVESFVRDNMKTFLMLCHPDKHGNLEAATAITQWVIDIRDKGGSGSGW